MKLHHRIYILCFLVAGMSSCKKFLDVELTKSEIEAGKAFANDMDATSVLLGMYQKMATGSDIFRGGATSVSVLCGLSADDLNNVQKTPYYMIYEENELESGDTYITSWWANAYAVIFQANDLMESMAVSPGVSPAVKDMIRGEALFVRAFCHFYLVNLYGDVPIILTTDYTANAVVKRQSVEKVYDQIVADLEEARQLLQDKYPYTEKVRPNKAAVSGMLARVYLYRGQWDQAIAASSLVIDPGTYTMPELDVTFRKETGEALWQFASEPNTNTQEYQSLPAPQAVGSSTYVLSDDLENAFEPGDKRITHWTLTYEDSISRRTIPRKYKAVYGESNTEYLIVLRLAEQYLIRAEACARQNKLSEAIADLDKVRKRTGLPLIADSNPGISQNDLLEKIWHEKRVEFFSEFGQRWFELKRLNMATAVLSPLKPKWDETDVLYPIPQVERDINPYLGEQNPGY